MNWKPKEGEWIIGISGSFYKMTSTTEISDLSGCLCYLVTRVKDSEKISVRTNAVRPAVLSDFAIEIPDYGKVWFVEAGHHGDSFIEMWDDSHEAYTEYTTDAIKRWELAALISHYNITVMPESLFKQLSEAEK